MWVRATSPPWPAATVISKVRRRAGRSGTLGPTAEDSKYYCVGIHRNAQGFSSPQLLPCATNADCSTELSRRHATHAIGVHAADVHAAELWGRSWARDHGRPLRSGAR